MARGRWWAATLFAIGLGCGSAPVVARPMPEVAKPAAPAPADPAPVEASASDEKQTPAPVPGTLMVVESFGLMTVGEVKVRDGTPTQRFRGDGFSYWIPVEKVGQVARPLVDRDEALRRLALLSDPQPFVDERPSRVRNTHVLHTLARGTDAEKLELLRQLYASPFAESPADIRQLERLLVDEIAVVLQRDRGEVVAELHRVHAEHGTFSDSPRKRKPDPPPPPVPRDPYRLRGYDYRGAFEVDGDTLVVGDPVFVTARRDEAPEVTPRYNLPLRVEKGRWHCYLEPDPSDPGEILHGLLLVHESVAADAGRLRAEATQVGKLWVDSGRMAAVDEPVRDDPTFADAILFEADVHGITGGRGCLTGGFGGDGTFPAWVHRTGEVVDFVFVDFTASSTAEFHQRAQRMLRGKRRR